MTAIGLNFFLMATLSCAAIVNCASSFVEKSEPLSLDLNLYEGYPETDRPENSMRLKSKKRKMGNESPLSPNSSAKLHINVYKKINDAIISEDDYFFVDLELATADIVNPPYPYITEYPTKRKPLAYAPLLERPKMIEDFILKDRNIIPMKNVDELTKTRAKIASFKAANYDFFGDRMVQRFDYFASSIYDAISWSINAKSIGKAFGLISDSDSEDESGEQRDLEEISPTFRKTKSLVSFVDLEAFESNADNVKEVSKILNNVSINTSVKKTVVEVEEEDDDYFNNYGYNSNDFTLNFG